MKHQIFSIYDEKAQAYLPPFFLHNIGMATRSFQDCINDDKHQFAQNPHDYTLFHIGEFQDDKGLITPFTSVKSLGNGVEFINQDTSTNDAMDKLEVKINKLLEVLKK